MVLVLYSMPICPTLADPQIPQLQSQDFIDPVESFVDFSRLCKFETCLCPRREPGSSKGLDERAQRGDQIVQDFLPGIRFAVRGPECIRRIRTQRTGYVSAIRIPHSKPRR